MNLEFFSLDGKANAWMQNILYIFAKVHPDLGYCQGMHEVLAPLVYVFGTDKNEAFAVYAEHDAYSVFVAMMNSLRILHLKSPSNPTKTGVHTQMLRLATLLRQHDAPLWQHLVCIFLMKIFLLKSIHQY